MSVCTLSRTIGKEENTEYACKTKQAHCQTHLQLQKKKNQTVKHDCMFI